MKGGNQKESSHVSQMRLCWESLKPSISTEYLEIKERIPRKPEWRCVCPKCKNKHPFVYFRKDECIVAHHVAFHLNEQESHEYWRKRLDDDLEALKVRPENFDMRVGLGTSPMIICKICNPSTEMHYATKDKLRRHMDSTHHYNSNKRKREEEEEAEAETPDQKIERMERELNEANQKLRKLEQEENKND